MGRPLSRLLLLLLACAAVYLIGNRSTPLWDRDEPRFAQTSRQMLQSGDWVVPRLYDRVRTAKTPLIYWAQATSMKLLGDEGEAGVFAARLPSAIAMILTLAIVAGALWRWVGVRHALWTALILSTCALVAMAAKMGLTDSVLLLFVTITQLCFYAIWRGHATWGVTITLAVAMGLALLTKGPVALGINAMTLLALWILTKLPSASAPEALGAAGKSGGAGGAEGGAIRAPARARAARATARVLLVILIVELITLPWAFLVERRHPGFLWTAFHHEIAQRATQGLEGHKGPPGYYLLYIWPTFLPWSLLLPMALVMGFRHRREPRVRFAFAAVVGPWLMFEIVQTKLPHYMLPCFPPLAFLTADAIVRSLPATQDASAARAGGNYPLGKPAFFNAVVLWGVVAIALGAAPWLAARWFKIDRAATAAISAAAVVYAAAVCVFFRLRRPGRGLAAMGVGMLGLVALLFGFYLPTAPFLRLSIEAADVLRRDGATGPGQAVMLDYKEPSLAFYQGGTIREKSAMIAPDAVLNASPRWLVMTGGVYGAPATDRSRLDVVAHFRGLDLSAALRSVEVLVVRQKTMGDSLAGPPAAASRAPANGAGAKAQ